MLNLKYPLSALVESGRMRLDRALSQDSWDRIKNFPLTQEDYVSLQQAGRYIGVSDEFLHVLQTFTTAPGELPAGFRMEFVCTDGECVRADLKRDISYGKNAQKRPTNVLFSADSANPYEVEPVKNIVANLTCNPAIVYSQFINNPAANVGNKFKNRDEVITELGRILGPGADISVEINDPFADRNCILEEIARFEEILTRYRLVIKIPHTGPVHKGNVDKLVQGGFEKGYDECSAKEGFYAHNLAYFLQEKGYRTNFTLMFEPYQTALALQAKPYFINTFLKTRYFSNEELLKRLQACNAADGSNAVKQLKDYMVQQDMISRKQAEGPDDAILEKARWMMEYHQVEGAGKDGLDSCRHSLRLLRQANLPDTRLILCSMGGEKMYPNIDKMLMEPEFADMTQRVVITAPPSYLARFTSAPGVLAYQRMFTKAVN